MTTNDVVKLATVRRLAQSGRARRIRLDAGVSIAEIARAIGVSSPTVYRWEVGENNPQGAAALAYFQLITDLSELKSSGRSRKAAASQ